ncbi:hypothetical protein, partial [Aeromonas hydrophila]|uniref:hypothetical protein n=1 Tax=Aeromonas hydrophila TaxID=644 RepID=UPI0021160DBF
MSAKREKAPHAGLFLCVVSDLRITDVLLPVHSHKLFHQLIFGFHHMDGIPEDAVHVEQMLMPRLLPVHPYELFH